MFRRLLERFSHPDKVLSASKGELGEVQGISPRLADAIISHKMPDHALRDLKALKQSRFQIVTFSDSGYPPLLRHIPDPPPFLYVYGELPEGDSNVAVVGSRTPSYYGFDATFRICRDLAEAGITVVSGMARGIDTRAHQGALEGKGKTIAVMGCGLGTIYPGENKPLFHEIAKNGAVISEFPIAAQPEARYFPVRNRIISGLCAGTVVVEAAQKSGSLITAYLAAEQNRQVFAVPGSVDSAKSMGTHKLLKQGAALVENAQDVLDHLAGTWQEPPKQSATAGAGAPGPRAIEPEPELSELEKTVLDGLGPYPVHVDVLTQRLSIPAGELAAALLQLELKGLARQEPGKLFLQGRSKK